MVNGGRVSLWAALLLLGAGDGGAIFPRQYYSCGKHYYLKLGDNISIMSPEYPKPYPFPLYCQWRGWSPPGSVFQLQCSFFLVPVSTRCRREGLFWESGKDRTVFCGFGALNATTTSNSFVATLYSYRKYSLGRGGLSCEVQVVSASSQETTTSTSPTSAPQQCGVKGSASRVVGGKETAVNEWPWQVAIRLAFDDDIFCGGTLISSVWVITAAHCMEKITHLRMIYLTLGDHTRDRSSKDPYRVVAKVVKVVNHPEYDPITVDNDIALLMLNEAVQYTQGVAPVCLPCGVTEETLWRETATVTGWGTTAEMGNVSQVLQGVELALMTTKECRRYLLNAISTNMLCTYKEGKDACQGDSGGPLTWRDDKNRYRLVGVVSWGYGCAQIRTPGVYAKVTNYISWIEEVTSINFCGGGIG